jgi:hypothetical protein
MNVRYRVELSQAERGELTAMLSKGKRAARKLKRAQILLAADAGCSDEGIVCTVAVGGSTVYRTKRRFVEGNLERAPSEDRRPGAERKFTGKEEALLMATACANPPEVAAAGTAGRRHGQAHRTREPVGRDGGAGGWPKAVSSPGARVCGAFPGSTANMSPARMEDVLDIYAEAPDPRHAETHAGAGWTDQRQIVVGVDPFALDELLEQGAVETAGTAKPSSQNRTQKLQPEGLANQALGADRFRGFFKRNIRDWMAPIERFIFWAISRGFIPEVSSLRSISSSVSVQRWPAGRGPVICPSPSV